MSTGPAETTQASIKPNLTPSPTLEQVTNPAQLLHACCAPCSGPAIPRLQTQGPVTVFFSNSNIYPIAEYKKRRDELAAYCERLGIPFVEDDYAPDQWLLAVKGWEKEPEKGRRCTECFRFRLERSAAWAKENDLNAFTTTLTLSPYKDSPLLLALGREIAAAQSINFLDINFKKQNGFQQSLIISRQENFYRQNYCGCQFSLR